MKRYFLFAAILFIFIASSIVGYINLRPAINGIAPLSLSGIKSTEIERGLILPALVIVLLVTVKKQSGFFRG